MRWMLIVTLAGCAGAPLEVLVEDDGGRVLYDVSCADVDVTVRRGTPNVVAISCALTDDGVEFDRTDDDAPSISMIAETGRIDGVIPWGEVGARVPILGNGSDDDGTIEFDAVVGTGRTHGRATWSATNGVARFWFDVSY